MLNLTTETLLLASFLLIIDWTSLIDDLPPAPCLLSHDLAHSHVLNGKELWIPLSEHQMQYISRADLLKQCNTLLYIEQIVAPFEVFL
ncbi:hypothetical protein E3N88_30011 [Mikania micrantha]|uniref:Uncharacterized protein n=1 Tax=Mikania micrantha TaxID=192012 RepID=A0A5N6ML02_9ASTR|nr:hypothetical protein E3N88_30011 [Mikania micrantha]